MWKVAICSNMRAGSEYETAYYAQILGLVRRSYTKGEARGATGNQGLELALSDGDDLTHVAAGCHHQSLADERLRRFRAKWMPVRVCSIFRPMIHHGR